MYSNSPGNRQLFKSKVLSITKIVLLVVSLLIISGCDTGVNPDKSEVEDIKIYFSPADKCDEKVMALIDNANQELHIAVYSFNRKPISDAVIRAYKRGVEVKVVFDESQLSGPNSRQTDLQNEGIAVKKDNPRGNSLSQMHNKFAVIDKHIVITGSYNWTTNATTNNDENLVVITSHSVAATYNTEFERIWAESKELDA